MVSYFEKHRLSQGVSRVAALRGLGKQVARTFRTGQLLPGGGWEKLSAVTRPAAALASGNFLEMQVLGVHLESNSGDGAPQSVSARSPVDSHWCSNLRTRGMGCVSSQVRPALSLMNLMPGQGRRRERIMGLTIQGKRYFPAPQKPHWKCSKRSEQADESGPVPFMSPCS